LRVASGEPLPLTQDQIRLDGHAIEARLYAEDPANGFLPSTGRLAHFTLPNDVRADSAVVSGNAVTSHYDPMLAKLIAHASERTAAINTLAAACAEVEVWPVKTNAWFLARCLEDEAFIAGEVDTAFIEARLDRLTASPVPHPDVAAAAAKALASRAQPTGFRLNSPPQTNAILWRDGGPVEAAIRPTLIPTVDLGDDAVVAFEGGAPFAFTRFQRRKAASEGGGDGALIAPMPGRIVSIVKAVGDAVKAGETVLSLEAMKMEHGLKAPFDGVVAELSASEGGQVSEGQMLARIAPVT
jgi:acetyl/propionyl-CoA carboxylase alpha subunit